ncbi:hypothetical protein T439DRAFT_306612 [Meredithblackwellia eburnea MCA 4105]
MPVSTPPPASLVPSFNLDQAPRSVSSPLASTSRSNGNGHPSHQQNGQQSRKSTRSLRPPKPSKNRSASAPLLPSNLQQHHFPVDPPSTNRALPFETKHAGPASLKRIFIGPHILGKVERGKGKERAHVDLEEDYTTSDSSDSGEDDLDAVDAEGRTARMRRRIERRKRRGLRKSSGHTVGSAVTQPGGAQSLERWTGGSFEIGGDIRDAVRRREEAAKRREESTRALTASVASPRPSKQVHPKMTAQTFTTARTNLDSLAVSGTRILDASKYKLSEPPQELEEKNPSLAHKLFRRPSDLPFSDSASVAPHSSPSGPHSPPPASKSILRANSSTLGMGFPSVNGYASYRAKTIDPAAALEQNGFAPVSPPEFMGPDAILAPPVPGQGDQPPPPADAVLARKGVDQVGFLDEDIIAARRPRRGKNTGKSAVLRKERMLIRAEWTEREDLPPHFDQNAARKIDTTPQPWEEFAVIWRGHHLELWTSHSFRPASYLLGRPKLKHVIPLNSRTRLSLYSSTDLIFCLTYRPNSPVIDPLATTKEERNDNLTNRKASRRAYVHRGMGTNIFTFRTKNNVKAKEWMWELYRMLGGTPPSVLDIAIPGLGARIQIPIPADFPSSTEDETSKNVDWGGAVGEGYRICTHEAVVKVCMKQLSTVPDWKDLFDECIAEGVEMKLAWRRGQVLDWVETGKRARHWSVVVGCILNQPGLETALELRPAMHYPTTVPMPRKGPMDPTTRLAEPPGVEGYLTRYKPSGSVERVYISSHDGHLFLCRPSTAEPPDAPLPVQETVNNPAALVLTPFLLGFASMGAPDKKEKLWQRMTGRKQRIERKEKRERRKLGLPPEADEDEFQDEDSDEEVINPLDKLESDERKRSFQQILAARGFVDLRDLVSIERAKSKDGEELPEIHEVDDLGGEEGLKVAADKEFVRRSRSLVLRTSSGVEVRFECYSVSVANEWIGRLQALVTYWTRRERVDAIEQMELQPSKSNAPGIQRFRGKTVVREAMDPAEAIELASPLLARLYNFCILQSCRSIMRGGRFYVKTGVRGRFRERYIFLLRGTLLFYHTSVRDFHGMPTKSSYHRRQGSQSLRGCYIYSGRLSAAGVNPAVNNWTPANGNALFPRIYASDGLRTSDEDEDCTLIIFKKGVDGPNQGLGGKGSTTILRARSMIERDEWLFALNAAIEQLQEGEDREREKKLREFPWLRKVKQ